SFDYFDALDLIRIDVAQAAWVRSTDADAGRAGRALHANAIDDHDWVVAEREAVHAAAADTLSGCAHGTGENFGNRCSGIQQVGDVGDRLGLHRLRRVEPRDVVADFILALFARRGGDDLLELDRRRGEREVEGRCSAGGNCHG